MERVQIKKGRIHMSNRKNGMKITTLEVAGISPAIKGMRLPMMSRAKSDTYESIASQPKIGEADMGLCKRLIKGGNEHAKYLRMIQVWADVDMPRYFWSEMDTYKFGTKNSESTMHRLLNNQNPITLDLFIYSEEDTDIMQQIVNRLEKLRIEYLKTKDFSLVVRAKRILPEGFLQLRTWNTNYAELRNIYHQRKHHRLKEEWQEVFVGWIKTLPYAKELIIGEDN